MRNAPYNGHKNWTHWNVALWIGNDEGLYRLALHHIKRARNVPKINPRRVMSLAASRFVTDMGGATAKTPDGARYSLRATRAALEGLES